MSFTYEAFVYLENKLYSIFPSSEVTRKPTNGNYELFLNKFKTFQENSRNLVNM